MMGLFTPLFLAPEYGSPISLPKLSKNYVFMAFKFWFESCKQCKLSLTTYKSKGGQMMNNCEFHVLSLMFENMKFVM